MQLTLEIISGPHQGKRIEAGVDQTVSIGRTPKASVALDDDFLSGEHFAIECDLKGCRLRDLKSRNGTQLNGELVTDAPLTNGDQIHAGRTDFVVQILDPLKTMMSAPPKGATIKLSTREAKHLAQAETREDDSLLSAARRAEMVKGRNRVIAGRGSGDVPAEPPLNPLRADRAVDPASPRTERPPSIGTERGRPGERQPELIAPGPSERIVSGAPTPQDVRTPRKSAAPSPLNSYEDATKEGRALHFLSHQPEQLMALVDATHEARVLELLRRASEEYQSLYRDEQNSAIAPYLISLPPQSDLLRQMVQQGWGSGWGVYLTCPLSLSELRNYLRSALMLTMPDGMELFSRFYDPRFFRKFLSSCTGAEAERFFGPITAYFMEDEHPEILLQFTRAKNGVEKKGHALSE